MTKSFVNMFNNINESQKFVLTSIQYVNLIYERQFSWKKDHPSNFNFYCKLF